MPSKSFEQIVEDLELTVKEIEDGDIPLEKLLKKFEHGIKLSKEANKRLDLMEKKIEVLTSEGELIEFDK